jgi:hypothetical protein
MAEGRSSDSCKRITTARRQRRRPTAYPWHPAFSAMLNRAIVEQSDFPAKSRVVSVEDKLAHIRPPFTRQRSRDRNDEILKIKGTELSVDPA